MPIYNLNINGKEYRTDVAADTYKKTGNWFYAMIRFTPDFFYAKPVANKQ